MRKLLVIIPLMTLLGGCLGFGGKKALPDKRTNVPGATEVNNYLDQATTPDNVHCVDEDQGTTDKPQTYFHNGYAKVATNHVGRDVSHQWDTSWDNVIGETLEDKFPEMISEDFKINNGDLIQMGCPGFSVASKEDKKRFWALFLASLARVQSGFDPSFQEGGASGLFALDPAKVGPLGGECAGKDKWDFMEPIYSFGCALQAVKSQMDSSQRLFSPVTKGTTIFPSLTGPARFETIKFFKSHAAPQFSFCSSGVDAPSQLVSANKEGENTSSRCEAETLKRINSGLDRSETKIKGSSGLGENAKTDGSGSEVENDEADANAVIK